MTVAEEGKIPVKQLVTKMVSGISSNDLTSLKKYLESDECSIRDDATSIEYSYNVSPQIYRQDADGSIILPIVATYPLNQVADAFTALAATHAPGKIVVKEMQ